jgi:DNA-directed RNA polymerase specialized sigma24 family protein
MTKFPAPWDVLLTLYARLVKEAMAGSKRNRDARLERIQEAFARAAEHQDELRMHPNPVGWVLLTLKNLLFEGLREVARATDAPVDDLPGREDPVREAIARETGPLVEAAIEEVVRAYRTDRLRRYRAADVACDGKTDDMARYLGVSAASVRASRSILRAALKRRGL